MDPHKLGMLQIHNYDYAPEEIYGALDGPLEDGKIHGVLVCVVEGDDPLPVSKEIVIRWNWWENFGPRKGVPEPHRLVVIAGGVAVWTGSVWLSKNEDSMNRVLEWTPQWWMPLPTFPHLASSVPRK